MSKNITFIVSDEEAEQIDFCVNACETTRSELCAVIMRHFLEEHHVKEQMDNCKKRKNERE